MNVLIDWSPDVNDGGVSLQGYRLYIKTHNGDFVQDPTNCDAETDAIIIQNSACTIPVTTLRQPPFALTTGEDVVAKVIAFNSIGDSAESVEGQGATIPAEGSVPGAPTSLQRIEPTDTTQASISWSAPSDDGGSVVTGYRVVYDQGSNSYTEADDNVAGTQFTKTGLTAGQAYKFKVQACNAIGCGADSVEFTVIAATVPSEPDPPTTTASADSIEIAWTAPSNQGGGAITVTSYTLEI